MRPNFPSQIAQRLAGPLQMYCGLLRIVASYEPCADSGWCSPLAGRRTSRTREEYLRDRNGPPGLVACRDTVSRASLSCAAFQAAAAEFLCRHRCGSRIEHRRECARRARHGCDQSHWPGW